MASSDKCENDGNDNSQGAVNQTRRKTRIMAI